jgi:metal-responsive CopG/Arc/MetJ family transcriptional regulator
MQKQFRPEIPKELHKGIDRFATAHFITRTAAVNVLLKKALVQGKWMTNREVKI